MLVVVKLFKWTLNNFSSWKIGSGVKGQLPRICSSEFTCFVVIPCAKLCKASRVGLTQDAICVCAVHGGRAGNSSPHICLQLRNSYGYASCHHCCEVPHYCLLCNTSMDKQSPWNSNRMSFKNLADLLKFLHYLWCFYQQQAYGNDKF